MPDEALSLSERRVSSWLFILTAVVYGYFFAGGGWNQNSQFDLTRAVVEQRTLRIDSFAANTGDVARYDGHLYSNKSPGVSLLAAIPYAPIAIVERMAGVDPSDPLVLTLNCYLCTAAVSGLLGALIPLLLYRYARRPSGRSSAFWVAGVSLIIALGTQLLPYATTLMTQVSTAALMFLSFVLLRRDRLQWSGLAGGFAALSYYLCVPVVVIFGALGVWRRRDRCRAAVEFATGALPPLLLLALYQKLTTGSLLRSTLANEDSRFLTKRALFGIINMPSLEAAYGITISPYRGLFYFAPVLIMSIGGAILWFRSRRDRAELAAILAVCAIFFAFNVTFNGWEAGFGIGARYLVPLIPFMGLLMLELRGFLRPLTILPALVSLLLNFAAVAVDPQPSATIPRPMSQYILPLLFTGRFPPDVPITAPWSAATFTGHTSVNRMAVDEAVPFSRHPPGSPASEWASFNLGEAFFGAGSAMSLLPIAAILIFGAVVILRKCRDLDRLP